MSETGCAERCAKVAVHGNVNRDFQKAGDDFQPDLRPRTTANRQQTAGACPGSRERRKTIFQCKGNTIKNRVGQLGIAGLVGNPGKSSPDLNIVVRRPLAAKVRQEGNIRWARYCAKCRDQVSGEAFSRRANQLRLSVADRITPIWCQVSGTA